MTGCRRKKVLLLHAPMNPIKLSQMACLDTTFICWNINHINLVPALKGRNLRHASQSALQLGLVGNPSPSK